MRAQRFITGVTVLFTVASITAQKSNFKTKEGPQPDQCSMSTHRHHYSDLRMVPVKVSDVDSCGFNYVDLEQNTIGLDHYLRFDTNFSFAEIGNNGRVEKFVEGLDRSKKSVRKDVSGIAIYCVECHAVIALKVQN